MKTLPPLLAADLQQPTTAIAFLWTITLANGRVIRGTDHDQDITMPAGVGWPAAAAGYYYAIANVTAGDIESNSDLSVDNLEVSGAFPSAPYTAIFDVTVDEIEAGLLDMAPVCVMICNWQAPAHGCFIVKSGFLGAITRDSDGKYTTEVRGLSQLLAQNIVQNFSATCNVVKFGDARCKYPVASITITGAVTVPTNLQAFSVSLAQADPIPPYSYVGGTVTFTSGANEGFSREVKLDPNKNGGVIQVWEQFPEIMEAGDTFTLSPGCDRQPGTCCNVYQNYANWRGYGVFIPGVNALLAGPSSVAEL